MANLTEGDWSCTVLGASTGMDDNEQVVVRINVKIDSGPDMGRSCTYEDTINPKSALYIGRSCKAVGWKGAKITDTLTANVAAWIAVTGGKSTVTIEHLLVKRGKAYDKWIADGQKGPQPVWAKVKALGRGPKPLVAPTQSAANDADDYMRQAIVDDGGAPPQDDVPHAGASDDIPFIVRATVRDINGQVL